MARAGFDHPVPDPPPVPRLDVEDLEVLLVEALEHAEAVERLLAVYAFDDRCRCPGWCRRCEAVQLLEGGD